MPTPTWMWMTAITTLRKAGSKTGGKLKNMRRQLLDLSKLLINFRKQNGTAIEGIVTLLEQQCLYFVPSKEQIGCGWGGTRWSLWFLPNQTILWKHFTNHQYGNSSRPFQMSTISLHKNHTTLLPLIAGYGLDCKLCFLHSHISIPDLANTTQVECKLSKKGW